MSTDDDDLEGLAARLRSGRPTPSHTFRATLLGALAIGSRSDPDPDKVKSLIVYFAAAGTLLLMVGALVTFL